MKIDESVLLAEGCRVTGDVEIGADSSVWYNAVIRADEASIRIGERTNIQDNCVLHVDHGHPLRVGDGVTVGHTAILHSCTVGDNSLIGMGSIVLNDAVIGKDCIIGAGALVTQKKEIPDGSLVFGNPAKIIRSLTPEEIESNRKSAAGYVECAKQTKGKELQQN